MEILRGVVMSVAVAASIQPAVSCPMFLFCSDSRYVRYRSRNPRMDHRLDHQARPQAAFGATAQLCAEYHRARGVVGAAAGEMAHQQGASGPAACDARRIGDREWATEEACPCSPATTTNTTSHPPLAGGHHE